VAGLTERREGGREGGREGAYLQCTRDLSSAALGGGEREGGREGRREGRGIPAMYTGLVIG